MTTFMREEIEALPSAADNVLTQSRDVIEAAGAALRGRNPALLGTIARGSSDHAASFLKYAVEITAGVPVASIGPSVTSIYGRKLRLDRAGAVAISQSGQSPDVVEAMKAARESGAVTIAFTNTPGSPLAQVVEFSIDLAAGAEKSVAATKTFAASIAGGLGLVERWTQDGSLVAAMDTISGALAEGLNCDWSPLIAALDGRNSLYVLGRGPGLAIAAEAALKLKETCGIHAEAYSSAEVLHGPARIVEKGFPVLVLAAHDAAESSLAETADRLAEQGARVYSTTGLSKRANILPFPAGGHPLVSAFSLIVPFYAFVEQLSRHRGFDPDRPPHLKKVTETV